MLTLEHGRFLVKLARRAIVVALQTGDLLSPPPDTPEPLKEQRGVFVTLRRHFGDEKLLRGCIGMPLPIKPLVDATMEAALSAAFRDPRFSPLEADELPQIVVEVSVLTMPQLLQVADTREYPSKVRIGKDGLLVEGDWAKGLLLPQVAPEHGLDAVAFLEQTCLKAGLEKDAWRKGGIRIYTFQAQIFAEKEPDGEVVEVTFP